MLLVFVAVVVFVVVFVVVVAVVVVVYFGIVVVGVVGIGVFLSSFKVSNNDFHQHFQSTQQYFKVLLNARSKPTSLTLR